jgi:hypothetical protein
MKPIVIRTRVMEIQYVSTGRLLRVLRLPISACEDLEERLFNMFNIHWQEEKIQELWKPHYYPDLHNVQRTADEWPSGLDSCIASGFDNPRWTKKAMWVQSHEVRSPAAKPTKWLRGLDTYLD